MPATLSVTDEDRAKATVPFTSAGMSQAVQKGLALLALFTEEQPIWRLTDIAAALNLAASTAHRYTVTLRDLGYLEQVKTREYRLTLAVLDLGMAARAEIPIEARARPVMEELARETRRQLDLTVLDGTYILYLAHLRSKRHREPCLPIVAPGDRTPAWCTATGKIMLAHLPDSLREEVLRETRFTKRGPNAHTRRKSLRAELELIRDEDQAINDEESAPGIVEVAVAIRSNAYGVDAALGITARHEALTAERLAERYTQHLLAASHSISERLGYRRPNTSDDTQT